MAAESYMEGPELHATRLRVWEVTCDEALLRDIEIPTLFRRAGEAARACGYGSCVSYEPEFPGEHQVSCPQLSNLFMYIDSSCRLRFCPVVEDTPVILSIRDHSAEEILRAHRELNDHVRERHGTGTCSSPMAVPRRQSTPLPAPSGHRSRTRCRSHQRILLS